MLRVGLPHLTSRWKRPTEQVTFAHARVGAPGRWSVVESLLLGMVSRMLREARRVDDLVAGAAAVAGRTGR
jgi:hypothetical protein